MLFCARGRDEIGQLPALRSDESVECVNCLVGLVISSEQKGSRGVATRAMSLHGFSVLLCYDVVYDNPGEESGWDGGGVPLEGGEREEPARSPPPILQKWAIPQSFGRAEHLQEHYLARPEMGWKVILT